jgi:ATP synthase protein I
VPKPKPNHPGEKGRNWIKYSGLAMQLIVTILVFTFLGQYLDGQLGTDPWLTVVFSLIGVVGGLYLSLRDFL